ncbi:SRPBCC family protein [Streptomyces sp. NPDC052042]|uniref:SRPBCC family protein n=1 Tax=Streptomyces sp. NPDC052042 TaxID=3365683 RepID=UPI0037CF5B8D
MSEVCFTATCDAPLDFAFSYLDDYRNVLEYWHGMTSYRPVGELDHGLGAVFESTIRLGPSSQRSTIKNVHWEENVRVSYESISGMRSTTSFLFREVSGNRSEVEIRIGFSLPGGMAGRALEKTLEPFISAAARNTAANISEKVSARYAGRTPDLGGSE